MFEVISVCKGGGYKYARTNPKHPRANKMGLYPLHRVLAENKLGRLLAKSEVVHHIDGNKDNNSPENLEVLLNSDHSRRHRPIVEKITHRCPRCSKEFKLRPNISRRREKVVKHGVFCSRQCSGSFAGRITS